jgi:hypothetical protein
MTPKIAFACATLALVASSHAQVLYATSFEAPTFTTGDIFGQDGWTDTASSTVAVVSARDARTGTQSVFIDSAPETSPYFGWKPINHSPGSNIVSTSIWMKPSDDSRGNSDFGFLSYDIAGSLIGGIIFAGPTVTVVDTLSTSTSTNGVVNLGQWNELRNDYNFATKLMTSYLNGAALATVSFTETNFGDADIYMNPTGFSTVYADDLRIEVVPEPATMAALALGVTGLVRRRRK